MTLSPEILISILTALGFGGILGAYFQSQFERQKQIQEQEHELKRKRYGAILVLMLMRLNPKDGLSHAHAIRPDLKNVDDVEREIESELLHGFLFASDDVIKSISEFIRTPSHSSYYRTAVSMRKDLWENKTSVGEQAITTFHKSDSG